MKKRFLVFTILPLILGGCNISFGSKDPTSITFTRAEVVLEEGEREHLTYVIEPSNAIKTVTWSVSEEDIIEIDNNGYITGLNAGGTTVTVTTKNNLSDSCYVRVTSVLPVPATGLSLNPPSKKLSIGDTFTITPTLSPKHAIPEAYSWQSDNDSVATVNSSGLVTALGIGEATITCTTQTTGLTATCNVVVKDEDEMWDSSQDSLRTGTKRLDFYNLNDTHGAVTESSQEPGLAKLSTYIKGKMNENPNGSVFTSSGDMWQGSADSNITRGKLVIDWMNYLNCSAQAIGNHEFDWKIDTINSNQERMNFPLLACNIVDKNTYEPVDWIQPYTTITRNGVHIGIVGAIGQGQTSDILASNVAGLKFVDPTENALHWINYLKENGADIILFLIHDSIARIDSQIYQAVDAIFGAHTHTGERDMISGTPAIQATSNGKNVGYINLNYAFGTQTSSVIDYGWDNNSVILECTEDSATLALWGPYEEEINTVKNRVVANYGSAIYSSEIPNIYNRYAYKYYNDTKTTTGLNYSIFAVVTNNARASIYPQNGVVTYGDVYKALPFDNTLTVCRMTGSNLKQITTYSSSHWYHVSSNQTMDRNDIADLVNNSTYYYILTIDYIALSSYYSSWMEIPYTFYEEEALPRNIFSAYLPGYPSNV